MLDIRTLSFLLPGAAMCAFAARLPLPPLAWFGLALVLHASRSMPAFSGAGSVWLVWLAVLALEQRGIMPVRGPAYFALVALMAATMTLPFALDRVALPKTGGLSAALVFPAAWVAVEFLRARLTTGATWGSIAYTQFGDYPLMQVAAYAGIWGISFLIAWAASTMEFAWRFRANWTAVLVPVTVCAVVLSAIHLAGALRVSRAPAGLHAVRVAALNRPAGLFAPGEITRITEGAVPPGRRDAVAGKLCRLHDWFLDGSRREARAGARLVVWPEQNLLVFAEDEPHFLERARRVAVDERVFLAMGMGTIHAGDKLPFENKLVLIDPGGRSVVSYRKSHAVPGWEAGIMWPGDGRVPVVPTTLGRLAGAICYDADFPEFTRQAGQSDADLLILPANDWKDIKDLHFRMHAFRAIENGVGLIRAAASGISGAFDPWGRVLGMTDFLAPGDGTLIVQVPAGGIRTLYSRTGDLFAWLCVAGIAGALAAVFRG
ncbi:MAG TPA: nitrilase-related carbon-nitrogen hydrolase [Candidatus Acidoferrales bacterium]|nr:nitrilase-related carbon-nitrogen hydrolase [Candidatus Acidoferrales bacterium]